VSNDLEAHRLSTTINHVRTRLDKEHSVSSLAALSDMSTRTFQRTFSTLSGMPVGCWIRQERLMQARILLKTSQASINNIAKAVGVTNVVGLRYHFRKQFGVSPDQYKNDFALTRLE